MFHTVKSEPASRGEVMVVEDDFAVREALHDLLEEQGYHVVRAANGLEALAQLRGGPVPGVILLDLMMPVMNGWELLGVLHDDPALASIPVVVISADHRLEERSRTLAASGHLSKPFELGALLAAVDRHCHRTGHGA